MFAGYSVFLHYLQLASHKLAKIGINVTKNDNQNSKYPVCSDNILFDSSSDDCVYLCRCSPMLSSMPAGRRFPVEKFQPEKSKEVELLNYLLDCYERVGMEERTAPKVRIRGQASFKPYAAGG